MVESGRTHEGKLAREWVEVELGRIGAAGDEIGQCRGGVRVARPQGGSRGDAVRRRKESAAAERRLLIDIGYRDGNGLRCRQGAVAGPYRHVENIVAIRVAGMVKIRCADERQYPRRGVNPKPCRVRPSD